MSGNSNMKFLLIGLAVAVMLSVVAPFLASSDPDGLESAAEDVIDESTLAQMEESEPFVSSPMPDYAIEGQGKMGEVLAILVGTIGMLAITFGFGKVMKSN